MRPPRTPSHRFPSPLRSSAILAAALALAGCGAGASGDVGDPPTTQGPAVHAVVQDREFDPAGHTLAVRFSEPMRAEDAEVATNYRVSGAVVASATLVQPDLVQLAVDRVVVPGDRVLDVLPGMRSVAGAVTAAIEDLTISSTDEDAPSAEDLGAEAVAGAANDLLTVTFDDAVVEGDVEDVARWTAESPLGTPLDLDGAVVTYDAGARAATLRLTGVDLTSGAGVAVALTSVRDIGGNPLPPMTLGVDALVGRVGGDVTPPTVVSAAPGEAPNTLTLVFSEPVRFVETADLDPVVGTRLTLTRVTQVGAPTLEALASTGAVDGYGALVTFVAPAVPLDEVAVSGVTDLAGNTMFPVTGHVVVARDIDPPALALGASEASAISGERNDVLTVRFDRPMHPEGLDDDYRYGLLHGFFADLDGARFAWDGAAEVTFTLDQASNHDVERGFAYILAVANLRSAQGVLIANTSVDTSLVGDGDAVPPGIQAVRLAPDDASSVIVTFDEALRASALAAAASYVSVEGRLTTTAAALGPRTARVAFSTPLAVGEVLEVAESGLVDLAGNSAPASASAIITAADVTPPGVVALSAVAVAGDGGDLVVVEFSEELDLVAATDLAGVEVLVDGIPLDLTAADARYTSVAATLTLALPVGTDLTTGAPIEVTFVSLVDVSGNETLGATAQAVVGGDAVPPAIAAAFVNRRVDAAGRVIDVRFDEALGSGATSLFGWTADGAIVQQVEARTSGHFRVTLSAPLAEHGTVALLDATDLAGNVAPAPLVVDPAE